jgi:hypothetical protein
MIWWIQRTTATATDTAHDLAVNDNIYVVVVVIQQQYVESKTITAVTQIL